MASLQPLWTRGGSVNQTVSLVAIVEEITPHFEIEKSEPNLKYSRVPYLNNFSSFSKPLIFGDPRFPMCQRQKGPTEEGGKRPKVGEKRGKKESNQI